MLDVALSGRKTVGFAMAVVLAVVRHTSKVGLSRRQGAIGDRFGVPRQHGASLPHAKT